MLEHTLMQSCVSISTHIKKNTWPQDLKIPQSAYGTWMTFNANKPFACIRVKYRQCVGTASKIILCSQLDTTIRLIFWMSEIRLAILRPRLQKNLEIQNAPTGTQQWSITSQYQQKLDKYLDMTRGKLKNPYLVFMAMNRHAPRSSFHPIFLP